MKLVAAKCPNCNSNIEVNPNETTIKCEYCKGTILINDAIEKYKIDISGKIEVKNLPKIEDILKIGERNYNLKNYDKAYKNYEKIVELEPDNSIALLRYAICKTLLNNYIDFPLNYLSDTFKNIVIILKEKNNYTKDIEQYIKESLDAINETVIATKKYYNTYTINISDLNQIQNKMISIVNCYEVLLEHTTENKNYIIEKIISVLKDIIADKDYKTGTAIEGGNFISTFKLNTNEKNFFEEKLNYYKNLLNQNDNTNINNDSFELTNKNYSNEQKNKSYLVIIDILLGSLIIGAFTSKQYISSLIMLLIAVIITSKKISEKIFKNNKKNIKYCIIILIILLLIAIKYNI